MKAELSQDFRAKWGKRNKGGLGVVEDNGNTMMYRERTIVILRIGSFKMLVGDQMDDANGYWIDILVKE